jgi:hypothetical protein
MEDNKIVKFHQHNHSIPLGPTVSSMPFPSLETEEDFMYDICHEICAELWNDFEWGQKPDFDFNELVEFAKTLLLKTALWNASIEEK